MILVDHDAVQKVQTAGYARMLVSYISYFIFYMHMS